MPPDLAVVCPEKASGSPASARVYPFPLMDGQLSGSLLATLSAQDRQKPLGLALGVFLSHLPASLFSSGSQPHPKTTPYAFSQVTCTRKSSHGKYNLRKPENGGKQRSP